MLNHCGNGFYASNIVFELWCLCKEWDTCKCARLLSLGKKKNDQTTNAWMCPVALPMWSHLCLLKTQKTEAQRSIKKDFYSLAPTETADNNWEQQNTELKTLVLFLGDYLYHWEKNLCWNAQAWGQLRVLGKDGALPADLGYAEMTSFCHKTEWFLWQYPVRQGSFPLCRLESWGIMSQIMSPQCQREYVGNNNEKESLSPSSLRDDAWRLWNVPASSLLRVVTCKCWDVSCERLGSLTQKAELFP